MAYRRKQSSGLAGLAQLLLLGIIAGLIFFMFDNEQSAQVSTVDDAARPSPETPPADAATRAPTQPAAAASTPAAPPEPTTVFIPTVGIHAPIIETYLNGISWDVGQLGTSAGHLQGTAWLDQPGNIVLAGHVELADGRRGIFAYLGELSVGDPIILQQGSVERHYVVRQLRETAPDDLSVLYPSADDQLTLITCDDYNFFQDAYLVRTVVIAERIA